MRHPLGKYVVNNVIVQYLSTSLMITYRGLQNFTAKCHRYRPCTDNDNSSVRSAFLNMTSSGTLNLYI